jgi:hypothetical protein
VQQVEKAAEPVVQQAHKAAEPVKAVAEQAVTTVKSAVPPVVVPPPPDVAEPELPAQPELPVVQPIVDDLVGTAEELPDEAITIVEDIVDSAEELPIPPVALPVPPLPPVVPALPQPPALPQAPAVPSLPAVSEEPAAAEPEPAVEQQAVEPSTAELVPHRESLDPLTLESADEAPSEVPSIGSFAERAVAEGLVSSVATSSSSLAEPVEDTHEASAELQDGVLAASAILAWEQIAPAPSFTHTAPRSGVADILPSTGMTTPTLASFLNTVPNLLRNVELHGSPPLERNQAPVSPLPSSEPAAVATSGNVVPSSGTTTVTALPPRLHVRLDTAWRTLSHEPLLRPPELVLGNLAPPG